MDLKPYLCLMAAFLVGYLLEQWVERLDRKRSKRGPHEL